MLLSVIIPCYHSEKTIGPVVERIVKTVKEDGRYDLEIILVNDNAPDAAWDKIEELADQYEAVKGISMMKNSGQHAALMAGYRASKGDVVVAMDDDGENPPEEMFKLVDRLGKDADVVYGDYPEEGKFDNGIRAVGSKLNDLVAVWLLGKPKDLYLSSYIASKREVVDEIIRYQGPFPYVDGLFLRSSDQIKNTQVEHQHRMEGESGYSMASLLKLWMNGFTAFSTVPLRLSSMAGFAFTGIGCIWILVILVQKLILHTDIEAGWSSIICLLLVIGGLILISLGLIGEYIGRIYITLNQSPQYVVYDVYQGKKKKSDHSNE
ncbi:MAG: glycosyltransferase family 2 protein [Ileibacterium sp.]|nr:glycosyltransferase family 2 protein [Ileibacterium sp.]